MTDKLCAFIQKRNHSEEESSLWLPALGCLPLPKPAAGTSHLSRQDMRGEPSVSQSILATLFILKSTDLTTVVKVTKQNRTSHLVQHPAITDPMLTISPGRALS